jgi:hypothetical protein
MEWAAETLTTTGYGADARWHHPLMATFVIVSRFLGLFLVFRIFPVYVLPYFEERFEARLPRTLPRPDDHVLFHRYGPGADSLIEELRRVVTPTVILEQDEPLARSLRERRCAVVVGSLNEDPAVLSGVERARRKRGDSGLERRQCRGVRDRRGEGLCAGDPIDRAGQ